MAGHLERFAAFALPRSTTCDEEDGQEALSDDANYEQGSRDEEFFSSTISVPPTEQDARSEDFDLSTPSVPSLPRVFDESFGFRIRHIEAVPDLHSPEPRFQPSGRWKPPVQTTGVRLVADVQYPAGPSRPSLPQDHKFVWRPPSHNQSGQRQNHAVSRMRPHEEPRYLLHKTASLFWAADSHTYLHVPFDCTARNIEEITRDYDYYEDDARVKQDDGHHEDDVMVGKRTVTDTTIGQGRRETWRRLRFFHRYPGPDHPTVSIARYDGGNTQLGGELPQRWNSTLISPTHRPDQYCAMDCQLAGDLSILLGLVAGCHANNNAAIAVISTWFPPSKGTSQWLGLASAEAETHMQRMEHSMSTLGALLPLCLANTSILGACRGMVVETFYDSRLPGAQQRLEQWEKGLNGPIIT